MKIKYILLCFSVFAAGLLTGCIFNKGYIAAASTQSDFKVVSMDTLKNDTNCLVISDTRTGYEYIIILDKTGVAIAPRKGVIPYRTTQTTMEQRESKKEK